jgi:uncharacterized phage protein (TIGR01671 family)
MFIKGARMRKILFRAKHGKEWIEGYYLCENEVHTIYSDFDGVRYSIDPETLGQYTGLRDKHGFKIFEGDIVDFYFKDRLLRGVVVYDTERVRFVAYLGEYIKFAFEKINCIEVIGDITDNPKLLEA